MSVIPVYQSSAVANATPSLVELTYDLSLNSSIIPAISSFSVMVNSVAVPVTIVAVSGIKVQLTLSTAIKFGDIITLSYTKPTTNPLQTASGGIAATFSAKSATNYLVAPTKDATPAGISLTVSPKYVHRTANISLQYTGSTVEISALAPETLTITDTYGKLYFEKLLVTGITSIRLPINLKSGIYRITILAKAIPKVSQKIMVY